MSPTVWHWLVLSGACLLLEAFTPGLAFFWLSVSAAATALLLWLLPSLAWQVQVLVFALSTVACVGGWWWWRRHAPRQEAEPGLNRRAESYVGREAVLVVGIGTGHGRVRIADTTWLADGPELPAGTRVRIVGASGAVLLVKPLDPAPGGPDGPGTSHRRA